MAMANIVVGSVTLIPSGVLQMTAYWNDSPKTGATYNAYILTNFRDPPSSAVHKKVGLTTMNIVIGDFNKDEFVPGNAATSGNFPGFQLGLMYRIYVEYFAADGTALNAGTELSVFRTPIIKASPPLLVQACGAVERTAPCNEIDELPFSIRVHWERPDSRGYDITYIPADAYQIEYYRVEVSASRSFQSLVANRTCQIGQADAVCNFDERVALLTGLTKAQIYYFRVLAGTIIGDGANSTVVASPRVAGGPGPPTAVSLSSNEMSQGVLGYEFKFREPTDTGDGLATLPILSYKVELSATGDFSTIVASATLDNNYPGGLKTNMTWSLQAYPGWGTLGTKYFIRVSAANLFGANGAAGDLSGVVSRNLLKQSLAPTSVVLDAVFALQVDLSLAVPTDTGTYSAELSLVDFYISQLSLDAGFTSVLREHRIVPPASSTSFYFLEYNVTVYARVAAVTDWGLGVYSSAVPAIPIIPSLIDAKVELVQNPLTGETAAATISFQTFSGLPADARLSIAFPDFELTGIALGATAGITGGVSIVQGTSGLAGHCPHGLECRPNWSWRDSNNDGCVWYESKPADCGFHAADPNGQSSLSECCICGGGAKCYSTTWIDGDGRDCLDYANQMGNSALIDTLCSNAQAAANCCACGGGLDSPCPGNALPRWGWEFDPTLYNGLNRHRQCNLSTLGRGSGVFLFGDEFIG